MAIPALGLNQLEFAGERRLAVELLHSQIPSQFADAFELDFALGGLDVVDRHGPSPRFDHDDLLGSVGEHGGDDFQPSGRLIARFYESRLTVEGCGGVGQEPNGDRGD